MNAVQAALLGLLQGLTEFLPVSSSGHLVLARAVMGLEEIPVLFDVVLHLATLVVVVWVFRSRIGAILGALGRWRGRRSDEEDRALLVLALRLGAASALTAVIGLSVARLERRDNPMIVGFLLIVTAAVLLSTPRSKGGRSMEELGWNRSLVLGAAQGLGVFPGISRSGITIGVGLMVGLDRKAAGEFSFLLSIPAITGAFLLSLKDASTLWSAVPIGSLSAGFLVALITGYASLKILLRLIGSGRLWIFALYLVPVGTWAVLRFAP